jgi:hypothetical protein
VARVEGQREVAIVADAEPGRSFGFNRSVRSIELIDRIWVPDAQVGVALVEAELSELAVLVAVQAFHRHDGVWRKAHHRTIVELQFGALALWRPDLRAFAKGHVGYRFGP